MRDATVPHAPGIKWADVPTQTLTAGGIGFAYRELGKQTKQIGVGAYVAQLQALHAWGQQKPADLSVVKQPVLIVNGEDDRMVRTPNSHDLAQRLPNSTLVIYPDAGHGGVFQYHADFVPKALGFLAQSAPP